MARKPEPKPKWTLADFPQEITAAINDHCAKYADEPGYRIWLLEKRGGRYKSRPSVWSRRRGELMVTLRGMGLSTPKIGDLLGVNHTAVIFATRRILVSRETELTDGNPETAPVT